MSDEIKFRKDGEPDGRGHSDGSKPTRFADNDGRVRKGRPKGAKSLKTIYRAAGLMPVGLTLPTGKKKTITTAEAIVLKQREKAMKGEDRAAERFLGRLELYSPVELEPDRSVAIAAEDAALIASAIGRGAIGWGQPPAPPVTSVPARNGAGEGDAADEAAGR